MSRLVWNHSTHAKGVIKRMRKLLRHPDVHTISPGPVHNARCSSPLQIRVTIPISGGHKLIARAGGTVQEIFVTTTLDRTALQEQLDALVR